MKKIFITTFLVILLATCKSEAAVQITSTGGTTISGTTMSTPVFLQATNPGEILMTLSMTCQDAYIVNTTNPAIKIPTTNLYIQETGGGETQMGQNKTKVVLSGGTLITGFSGPYTFAVKNMGSLPAGTYSVNILVTSNTISAPASTVYTVFFSIPGNQSISTITNPVNITLQPNDVFNTGATIENTTSPQINIVSNENWKLVLNTNNIGILQGNYYFQIVGVSSNVTSYITDLTQVQPNQQYVLASGNVTSGNDYITIKYFLKNSSGNYVPEGTFNNNVNYIIMPSN